MRSDRDGIIFYLESCTDSKKESISDTELQHIDVLCQKSVDGTNSAFDFLMNKLKHKLVKVKLLALVIINHLFHASTSFREIMIQNFPQFLLYTLGLSPKISIVPENVSEEIKEKTLSILASWDSKYGKNYRPLRLGMDYLRSKCNIMFPTMRILPISEKLELILPELEHGARQKLAKTKHSEFILQEIKKELPSIEVDLIQFRSLLTLVSPEALAAENFEDLDMNDANFHGLYEAENANENENERAFEEIMRNLGVLDDQEITVEIKLDNNLTDKVDDDILKEIKGYLASFHTKQLLLQRWHSGLVADSQNKDMFDRVSSANSLLVDLLKHCKKLGIIADYIPKLQTKEEHQLAQSFANSKRVVCKDQSSGQVSISSVKNQGTGQSDYQQANISPTEPIMWRSDQMSMEMIDPNYSADLHSYWASRQQDDYLADVRPKDPSFYRAEFYEPSKNPVIKECFRQINEANSPAYEKAAFKDKIQNTLVRSSTTSGGLPEIGKNGSSSLKPSNREIRTSRHCKRGTSQSQSNLVTKISNRVSQRRVQIGLAKLAEEKRKYSLLKK